MNKLMLFALTQVITGIAIVGLYLFFEQNNNKALPLQLLDYQKTYESKQQELITLQQQLKINEINLITNIDEVKSFINNNANHLTLSKVKKTDRGMEYLLIGKSIDILILLHKAIKQQLKIDISRLLFKTQDKLIAEITIIGMEQ